ncbi:interleukin-12 subunit alpha [Periophthalmus magnuspinnatus]|uniref:interleukin-12 subunit alpha n=1 Tax=Periophthalmus magnuspinnatus TaxID=409849 RepID=UPI00145A1DBE|nr:interleukin-12 subunit alpha [Periophthalmus magnuspinnatus]
MTVAHPVRTDGTSECAQRAPLFRSLLSEVSDLLKNNVLWYGINSDRIHPTNSSDTVQACAPKNECWKNIVKDLAHYEAIISSYIELKDLRHPDEEVPPLRQTLQMIQNLLKSCPFTLTEEGSVKEDVSGLWVRNSSYSNRQKMLMMMRAFHIRTITFNRAVGYIASGEHMTPGPL